MEEFSAKLVEKNIELKKEKSVLEEQIEKYKNRIRDLEINNRKHKELQANPDRLQQRIPNQKPEMCRLEPSQIQHEPYQKAFVVDKSLMESQSHQPGVHFIKNLETSKIKPSNLGRNQGPIL
jgi:hypothetical protein